MLHADGADLAGGGTLTLRIAGATSAGTDYDRLDLGSSPLTLGGGSALVLDLAGLSGGGVTVPGVVLHGGATGTFATITLANNPSGYGATAVYRAGAVDIVLDRPRIDACRAEDSDHDGHLDRIRVEVGGDLDDQFAGLTATVAGYTVAGYATGTAGDGVFYILLQPRAAFDTGATPAVAIAANSTLRTAGGGLIPVGAAPATIDAAPPVLVSAFWTGSPALGVQAGDALTLNFSEPVAAAGLVLGDLVAPVLGDSLGGTPATAIPDQTGSAIVFALPAGPVLTGPGTFAPAVLAAGSPSGVLLAGSTHIQDLAAVPNPAWTTGLAGAVDLGGGMTVTAIAPTMGPVAGGTAVTITGSFFTGATVTIGGSPATGVSTVSATTITCTTPPGAIGPADVTVHNGDGQSVTLPGAFIFRATPPVLTAVSPDRGAIRGGTAVAIRGAHFAAGAQVRFDGVLATGVSVLSATTITCLTPPGRTFDPVAVSVTNVDLQGATRPAAFAYIDDESIGGTTGAGAGMGGGGGCGGGGLGVLVLLAMLAVRLRSRRS